MRNIWLPAVLFVATCVSTFWAGYLYSGRYESGREAAILSGLMYSFAVMTILLCHEMGHYLQARRYGVRAKLPYFIPMPFTPIGTFGAVILMDPRRGNLRAIFDIGISGPLAGLVPTFLFLFAGLFWSHCGLPQHGRMEFGAPLLVKMMYSWMHGPLPANQFIQYHPLAFAGWVGLLVTSINLVPIGQLDGGHILFGMFPRWAHVASAMVLAAAIGLSIWLWLFSWWPMLGLIAVLGTRHPPTADDSVPLGGWRYVLGLATLAFLFVSFMPQPIAL